MTNEEITIALNRYSPDVLAYKFDAEFACAVQQVSEMLAQMEARAEKAEMERDELQREMLVCRNGWKKAELEMQEGME